ncbi:signal peptidase I [Streptococcus pseudoporcinus]|uniref:Signal peptidase I n=1 Tax=Streptococcus pseudoporcinus TaxID=361101 RepID=A0A4U9XNK7_9STRE|nr:signal peptidase I [Streptococcus pseudoporcinus]VTS15200.1 Signal peptidase I [Streptococcus pseudoporcinus]VUC67521.1 Signal peptidase I [Streptococcus pseudoporcinus]VUC98448.1 Signal peptidase I [Streptococcus pseudoporcinus]VUC98838.1 Signal peptidase I [Streptococcus pseudoporcinus]
MVKRDFIRNIIIVLIVAIVAVLLSIFVFSTFEVTKESENSYLKAGDLVTIKHNVEPQYKDFVVYKVDKKEYVSRVIATAGQRATYMDDIFYLNNRIKDQPYIEKLKNDYLRHSPAGSLFTDDFNISTISKGKSTVIPSGKYLLLNDNRRNRADSRQFGLIDKKQIKGVVTFRVLPIDEFGFVEVD